MINIQGVSKFFGEQVLFKNAEAQIGLGAKIALIGANGAGKSTLIKMILGQETPDEGRIQSAKKIQVGHLAQDVPKFSGRSILEEVLSFGSKLDELKLRCSEMEASFQTLEPSEEELNRYAKIREELELFDEDRLRAKAQEILQGMGFRDPSAMVNEFSGGWLMRVAMSRLLLQNPDLLILDEPTNHLDLESLLWMEGFLARTSSALLIVSHDLEFVQRVTSEVWEIENLGLHTFHGRLPEYVKQKALRRELLQSNFEQQQKRIEALENFIRRFGAKATKAKQAQSRVKQLEKMERIEIQGEKKKIQFRFPPAPHSGKIVLTAENLDFGYGDKNIFSHMNWTVPRGSRIAIVGQNGAGKTTLLKLLAGMLQPAGGKLTLGHGVAMGYYAQIHAEALSASKSILEELLACAPPEITPQYVRNLAGSFLFSGNAIDKRCNVLSGGEKARVAIAKLLLQPTNFLLLDEPTNHLDVASKEVLLEALEDYEGTLCIVSHDRSFMEPLVDAVLEVTPKPGGAEVKLLTETYGEYVERKRAAADGELTMLEERAKKVEKKIVPTGASGKVSHNKKIAWEKELVAVEAEVQKIEKKLEEITHFLSDPLNYEQKNELKDKIAEQVRLQSLLLEKTKRWEELVESLEQAKS